MTKLIEKTGDMFQSDAEAYAHGVNVKGLMGAGVAVAFKTKWPDMYANYKTICGLDFLHAGEVYTYDAGDKLIFNIASQDLPGANAQLKWLEEGLRDAINEADELGIDKIAMPRIGCGIGGLEWENVRDILDYYSRETDVDIEVWTL
jgi:O-acetyl-ADP-ribose deacetylase (regulator of RNase III)